MQNLCDACCSTTAAVVYVILGIVVWNLSLAGFQKLVAILFVVVGIFILFRRSGARKPVSKTRTAVRVKKARRR